MSSTLRKSRPICLRCAGAARRHLQQRALYSTRGHDEDRPPTASRDENHEQKPESPGPGLSEKEKGAMSRRLEEATEEVLLTGGSAGLRAVEDAGFSDELKEKLFDKISEAKFRKQYSGAFATATMPEAAGPGTRAMAGAEPWTGEESTADSVLRMLDDARKPLKPADRGKFQIPPVDMRIKRDPRMSSGRRVASAREKAMAYASTEQASKSLSEKERDEFREELKERFQPGARGMPNTVTGLAALANERIENAISRGQFKNIPRGPGIERDRRADNPFIDTTEYILNKMIQRQDIVPPWIEKQQEVTKAAAVFRARLRNDWKRHAARMIAASGGSLLEQMKKAEAYAAAERIHNPRRRAVDQISVPVNVTHDPVMAKMRQESAADAQAAMAAEAAVSEDLDAAHLPAPYRDPDWEAAEMKYLTLSIDTLNATTRSYNLQAPDLAKKPYFSLKREMDSCYADVAPLLAAEIQERALGPKAPILMKGGVYEKQKVGIWEHLGRKDQDVRIHLEGNDKAYGLKEWWRDVWKKT